jgi:hypothetical protein
MKNVKQSKNINTHISICIKISINKYMRISLYFTKTHTHTGEDKQQLTKYLYINWKNTIKSIFNFIGKSKS